jgi:hypothetical protein
MIDPVSAAMTRLRYDSRDESTRHEEDTEMAPAIAPPTRLPDVVPGGSTA